MAKTEMQRALEEAGLAKFSSAEEKGGNKVQGKCKICGKPVQNPKHSYCADCYRKHASGGSKLPDGYLAKGYFDEDGNLHPELMDEIAQEIAKSFGSSGLTQHQIRAFFSHARDAEERLKVVPDFNAALPGIKKLKVLAHDRATRAGNPLPEIFVQFIDANINAIKTEKDFCQGFMPHFEAVVGFSATYLKKR